MAVQQLLTLNMPSETCEDIETDLDEELSEFPDGLDDLSLPEDTFYDE